MTENNRKKSEELAEEGFDCLREGDYEAALEIAKELEELRHTGAFDIAAQAYAGLDDLERAIETLERGVDLAPDCWVNWQLLGNYRSDTGSYEEAALAYQRALSCPGAWPDSIRLNQAILAGKHGDYGQALNHLDTATDPGLALRVAAAKISVLEDMGRLDEALSLAEAFLVREWDADEDGESLAYIAATQGRIRIEKGANADDVRRSAVEAAAEFGSSPDLLALIRDLDGCYSSKAKYFRLLVGAAIPEEHPLRREAKGYFVSYDVVAETPEQALKWVQEFEHIDIPETTLSIEESEMLEERPKEPMGVYRCSDRHSYEDEDDE